jgi:hypothetical protein
MEKAFLNFVIAIIALLFLLPLLFAVAAQQKKMLAWAIPRAVEIARFQGWVSPHRLMTQAHMTKKDAQYTLVEACKQGLLFQAVNGRYYIKQ